MSGAEKVLEHLKLIQGVITRLGSNSFLIKGWTPDAHSGGYGVDCEEGHGKPLPDLTAGSSRPSILVSGWVFSLARTVVQKVVRGDLRRIRYGLQYGRW